MRIRGSSSKVHCNRVVPQEIAKDSHKNDGIAVDTRFQHCNTGSKRPLGTMEELLEVVKVHLSPYENTAKICKSSPAQVNPSELTPAKTI